LGTQEAVATGDLFGEGRDEAFAVYGEVKGRVDAGQEFGDVQGGSGPLEYVISHIHLRQTLATGPGGGFRGSAAEAAHGAQLGIEGGFKHGQQRILEIVRHAGTPPIGV
jgi:hypothetical protein